MQAIQVFDDKALEAIKRILDAKDTVSIKNSKDGIIILRERRKIEYTQPRTGGCKG